jgi:hypothetical protein
MFMQNYLFIFVCVILWLLYHEPQKVILSDFSPAWMCSELNISPEPAYYLVPLLSPACFSHPLPYSSVYNIFSAQLTVLRPEYQ